MSTDPVAASTAGEVKFSEAISCSVVRWRSSSSADQPATSGSWPSQSGPHGALAADGAHRGRSPTGDAASPRDGPQSTHAPSVPGDAGPARAGARRITVRSPPGARPPDPSRRRASARSRCRPGIARPGRAARAARPHGAGRAGRRRRRRRRQPPAARPRPGTCRRVGSASSAVADGPGPRGSWSPGGSVRDPSPRERAERRGGQHAPGAWWTTPAGRSRRGGMDAVVVRGRVRVRAWPTCTARRPAADLDRAAAEARRRPPLFGPDARRCTELEAARGLMIPVHVYPSSRTPSAVGRLDAERAPGRIGSLGRASPRWPRPTPTPGPHRPSPRGHRRARAQEPDDRVPLPQALHGQHPGRPGRRLHLQLRRDRRRPPACRGPWVFPVSSAEANDHWFLSERAELRRSPAIRLAARPHSPMPGSASTTSRPSTSTRASPVSCRSPRAARHPDRRRRQPPHATGGLTFGGGPGNNYTATGSRRSPGRCGRAPGPSASPPASGGSRPSTPWASTAADLPPTKGETGSPGTTCSPRWTCSRSARWTRRPPARCGSRPTR